jgi:hypothetical protein
MADWIAVFGAFAGSLGVVGSIAISIWKVITDRRHNARLRDVQHGLDGRSREHQAALDRMSMKHATRLEAMRDAQRIIHEMGAGKQLAFYQEQLRVAARLHELAMRALMDLGRFLDAEDPGLLVPKEIEAERSSRRFAEEFLKTQVYFTPECVLAMAELRDLLFVTRVEAHNARGSGEGPDTWVRVDELERARLAMTRALWRDLGVEEQFDVPMQVDAPKHVGDSEQSAETGPDTTSGS